MGIESWNRAIDAGRTFAGTLPVSNEASVDGALDALAIFAREHPSSGTLEPITDAARSILSGPTGVRAQRILDGITSWVDASRGGRLSTIMIGDMPGADRAMQGLILHRLAEPGTIPSQGSELVNYFDGPLAERIRSAEMAYLREPDGLLMATRGAQDLTDLLHADYQAIIPRLQALDAATGTHVQHAWDNARTLLADAGGIHARERRWDQVYFLLHELEHARSARMLRR